MTKGSGSSPDPNIYYRTFIFPSRIRMDSAFIFVAMYNYHPRLFAKSNKEKQYFSHRVHVISNGRRY